MEFVTCKWGTKRDAVRGYKDHGDLGGQPALGSEPVTDGEGVLLGTGRVENNRTKVKRYKERTFDQTPSGHKDQVFDEGGPEKTAKGNSSQSVSDKGKKKKKR